MQVFVVAPFVAVMVTVSPDVPPAAEIVGVVSVVMSSLDDVPVSEAAARSGVDGTAGEVESMIIEREVPAAEVLPAGSVSVALTDHVPSARVGRSQDDAEPTK